VPHSSGSGCLRPACPVVRLAGRWTAPTGAPAASQPRPHCARVCCFPGPAGGAVRPVVIPPSAVPGGHVGPTGLPAEASASSPRAVHGGRSKCTISCSFASSLHVSARLRCREGIDDALPTQHRLLHHEHELPSVMLLRIRQSGPLLRRQVCVRVKLSGNEKRAETGAHTHTPQPGRCDVPGLEGAGWARPPLRVDSRSAPCPPPPSEERGEVR
jgi:hypothetical protein